MKERLRENGSQNRILRVGETDSSPRVSETHAKPLSRDSGKYDMYTFSHPVTHASSIYFTPIATVIILASIAFYKKVSH